MAIQHIKIKEITSKPTARGSTYTSITDENGTKCSGFDEALSNLKPGDVIEADIITDGKYRNINEWNLIEHGEPPKPKIPVFKKDSASIESQVAVKAVVELWIADKLDEADSEVIATRNWLMDKLGLPKDTIMKIHNKSPKRETGIQLPKAQEKSPETHPSVATDIPTLAAEADYSLTDTVKWLASQGTRIVIKKTWDEVLAQLSKTDQQKVIEYLKGKINPT